MRLLLLAGTGEARHLASALASRGMRSVVVSTGAGTRPPSGFGLAARIGGFGGAEGFRDYLIRERIVGVLDATHPFAHRFSARSAAVCAETGTPYLQFLRPAWRPGPDDDWHFAEDEADAARLVPQGASVLIATGRDRLDAFGPMAGRRVLVRCLGRKPDRPPPFADGAWLAGDPPFAVADETRLFGALGLDWLIARNAGGPGSRPKLDAARSLRMRVAMIRRPPQPEAPRVEMVAAAMAWVSRVAGGAERRGG